MDSFYLQYTSSTTTATATTRTLLEAPALNVIYPTASRYWKGFFCPEPSVVVMFLLIFKRFCHRFNRCV